MLKFSIDIGGTFTDVVAETETGLSSIKVLTTPQSPDRGALDGMARLLGKLGKTYADISAVIHGTTLATNALIERRGAKTAFVTTAGFRDVLDMRYEKRFDQYDLNIEMPKSLVERPLRFGLQERILADGSILKAPQDDEIDALATELKHQKVEAVAIGFLHAYRNPAHESYVADRMQKILGRRGHNLPKRRGCLRNSGIRAVFDGMRQRLCAAAHVEIPRRVEGRVEPFGV